MSEQSDAPRPTVALAVAEIQKTQALMELGFTNVQRQLDTLVGLPERVARLEEAGQRVSGVTERVAALEARAIETEKTISWRRGPLLSAAVALAVAVVTVAVMVMLGL